MTRRGDPELVLSQAKDGRPHSRGKGQRHRVAPERSTLLTAPIPFPPLPEQRRIVAKIELLFVQADAIERAVAIAQKRADKIDQAILARAFRGEL